MGGRRQFGSVRRLRSGRWQASYWWEGTRHVAPSTFDTKIGATRWLSTVDADLTRGGWVDPRAGQVRFCSYSQSWLALRTDLRPRTRELYGGLLARHLGPAFGQVELGKISPSHVRVWFSDLSGAGGPGQMTAARCYRLLRTIMNTAVTDGLVVKSPCQVKGAGTVRSPERPIASVPEVHALAAAIAPRFRAAVFLAAFCSLRRGEILGLRRGDVDLLHGLVTVRRAVVSLADGTLQLGDPKTAASRRAVAIPKVIVPALEEHLDLFVAFGADAHLFLGEKGGLRRPHVLEAAWDGLADGLSFITCTSTTCATVATHGQPQPGPALGSSWPGWATPALPQPCATSTPRPTATEPLLKPSVDSARRPKRRSSSLANATSHVLSPRPRPPLSAVE